MRQGYDYSACRCCGNQAPREYGPQGQPEATICTGCIPKHWGKHARGKNVRRCREFGTKEVKA